MSNFTITRITNTTDEYGCDNFMTNQEAGDTASLATLAAGDLDGSIEWRLDANPGYIVDVDDFSIAGTIPTNVAPIPGIYRPFKHDGTATITPVLGVVLDIINATSILITLYLHPESTHGIPSGTPGTFVMPSYDVDAIINITGCATLDPNPINLRVVNGGAGKVDVTTDVSNDGKLVELDSPYGEIHIAGHIPQDNVEKEILSYTINAKPGERFVSTPNFSMSTDDYRTISSTVKDDSGNIISTTIKIFK